MDEVLNIVKEWWGAIVIFGGIAVGYLELKFTAKTNKRDIERVERDLRDHGNKTERMFEEIRADIKILLGKVK